MQGWRNPTGPSDKSGKNWPGPMKMSMLPDQVSGEYSTLYDQACCLFPHETFHFDTKNVE